MLFHVRISSEPVPEARRFNSDYYYLNTNLLQPSFSPCSCLPTKCFYLTLLYLILNVMEISIHVQIRESGDVRHDVVSVLRFMPYNVNERACAFLLNYFAGKRTSQLRALFVSIQILSREAMAQIDLQQKKSGCGSYGSRRVKQEVIPVFISVPTLCIDSPLSPQRGVTFEIILIDVHPVLLTCESKEY